MSTKPLAEESTYPARVEKCSARNCAYNGTNQCRAFAITVGEAKMTKCETYTPSNLQVIEKTQTANVGACKVTSCAYNEDFECRAKQVRIGENNGQPGCLDYITRFAW